MKLATISALALLVSAQTHVDNAAQTHVDNAANEIVVDDAAMMNTTVHTPQPDDLDKPTQPDDQLTGTNDDVAGNLGIEKEQQGVEQRRSLENVVHSDLEPLEKSNDLAQLVWIIGAAAFVLFYIVLNIIKMICFPQRS